MGIIKLSKQPNIRYIPTTVRITWVSSNWVNNPTYAIYQLLYYMGIIKLSLQNNNHKIYTLIYYKLVSFLILYTADERLITVIYQ